MRYTAYQLTFTSELMLPELHQVIISEQSTDVSIIFGEALRGTHPRLEGLCYQIQPEVCWFDVPHVAQYTIREGKEIMIQPVSMIDEDSLRVFLYAICFPILLIQRGFFVLHGAALRCEEEGVAFLMHFGQGKSTLLASLMQRGHLFLSDDICVLNQSAEILPGIPYLTLRTDVIEKLNIERRFLKQTRPNVPHQWGKSVCQSAYAGLSNLRRVYIVHPHRRSGCSWTPLLGFRKVNFFKQYIYQPEMVKALGKDALYFKESALLATHFSAVYIEASRLGVEFNTLVDSIQSDLKRKEVSA